MEWKDDVELEMMFWTAFGTSRRLASPLGAICHRGVHARTGAER